MKQGSGNHAHEKGAVEAAPSFRERMLFVIWLAGKNLGVDSAQDFALAIGKGASQLSKWINEDPRPEWKSIQAIAEPVKVDPVWLDNPARANAIEPADFREWLTNQRRREIERAGKKAR